MADWDLVNTPGVCDGKVVLTDKEVPTFADWDLMNTPGVCDGKVVVTDKEVPTFADWGLARIPCTEKTGADEVVVVVVVVVLEVTAVVFVAALLTAVSVFWTDANIGGGQALTGRRGGTCPR